jgi:hypothetical protein
MRSRRVKRGASNCRFIPTVEASVFETRARLDKIDRGEPLSI